MLEKAKARAAEEESRRDARANALREKGRKLTAEEQFEKIDCVIGQIAAEQRGKGYPVGPNGRIDTADFQNTPFYGKEVVGDDLSRIKRIKESFTSDQIGGKLMEKITVAVFRKFLPEADFVRTSNFDDFVKAGQDAILIWKGNPIAAFDMTMEDNLIGKSEQEKMGKVNEINKKGGAIVKYCFRKDKDTNSVVLYPETNLPVFAIKLNPDAMNAAVDQFNLSNEANDAEKRAFYQIVNSLYKQLLVLESQQQGGLINFNLNIGGRENFTARVAALRRCLEKNMPPETVKDYLTGQLQKAKTGSVLPGRPRRGRKRKPLNYLNN